MTQKNSTFKVECLDTGKILGVFDSKEKAVNYCQENKLEIFTIPSGQKLFAGISSFQQDRTTNFVRYSYNKERN